MLSNLKLRTLFVVILSVLSTLVLTISVVNWNDAQLADKNASEINSIAVVQASNLRFSQIQSLRGMARIYDVATLTNPAARKREITVAQDFLRQSRTSFAVYEREATKTEFGRTLHIKIQPAYQRYMKAVDSMLALAEDGDDGSRINQLRQEEVVPANDAYQAVMDEFGRESDRVLAEVNDSQERMNHRATVLLVGFVLLLIVIAGGAMTFLTRHVLKPLEKANEHFDRIASGDLTQRIVSKTQNEIGQLFQSLSRMQEGLGTTVAQVRTGVEELRHSVHDIYSGNVEISSRTEQQASALQETAASMEELSGTLRQNTDNAEQADQLAMNASRVAQEGGQAVEQVVGIMGDISSSSDKVAEIVSVIDGIAFQTNILALNAAVEAARAGDQGKGFAVVASEVRSLAQRSAQAAREIKDLIEGSLQTIRKGASEATQAGEVIQELVTSVEGVTTLMKEISLASREQAEGISQVNVAVSQMDTAVQQNAALIGQATSATACLQEQSDKLAQAVAVFKLQAQGL